MSSDHEAEAGAGIEPQQTTAVDDQLIDELVTRAQAEGLQLTGEGGLLQQLTKRLLESALEGEITDHSAMTSMIRPGRTAVTPATEPVPRPCSPKSER